jgi:dihydroanticapsin dehydrogenase
VSVRQFVREGARVVIVDLDDGGARDISHSVGPSCHVIRCDLACEEEVSRTIEDAVAWLGGLDTLVNNAGLQYAGKVTDFDSALWERLMAVNVRAHFFMAKHAVPHLKKSGGGSIINTSSVAGQRGSRG